MKRMILFTIATIFLLTACSVQKANEKLPNANAAYNQKIAGGQISQELENKGDDLTNEYKNNPIDKYIDEKLVGNNLTYAEIRDIKRLYFMLWKSEYDNVINFLKEKCEYNEDKSTIKKLDREIEKYVEKMSDVFEISYDNSLGLSAGSDMLYNKGEIYNTGMGRTLKSALPICSY